MEYIFYSFGKRRFGFPLSRAVWEIPSLAALVQFPFRMLAVGTLVTPWLVASVSENLLNKSIIHRHSDCYPCGSCVECTPRDFV